MWRRALDEFNELRNQAPASSLPYAYVIEACLDAGQTEHAQRLIEEHEKLQFEALKKECPEVLQKQTDSDTLHIQDHSDHGSNREKLKSNEADFCIESATALESK
jgi:hypothetical protein